MNALEFWTEWGSDLDDRRFANAFTAMGMLSARAIHDPRAVSGQPSPEGRQGEEELAAKLNLVLSRAVQTAGEDILAAPWRFPLPTKTIVWGGRTVPLGDLPAASVANAWDGMAGIGEARLRLTVEEFPSEEPVRPWFRLLGEAGLGVWKSAYINLDAEQAVPYWKWPLRLGFFPGNGGEDILHPAGINPTSDERIRILPIDRSNANCDLLIFDGSSALLLRELLDKNLPIKANLIIARGTFEDDLPAASRRLASIAAECRAGGIVFLAPGLPDETFRTALDDLTANISQNIPLDFSLVNAFGVKHSADPVLFLSGALADFRIEHLIPRIHLRLERLERTTRLEIEPEILERFKRAAVPDAMLVEGEAAGHAVYSEIRTLMEFGTGGHGAADLMKAGKAVDAAETVELRSTSSPRFLMEQVLVKRKGKYEKEGRALLAGIPTKINVRIGPPDADMEALAAAFPEDELPKDRDSWRLTVVLTDPVHLKKPLVGSIRLPQSGPSTVCSFRFTPAKGADFDGRVSILHRGRVIQTAALRSPVVEHEDGIPAGAKIKFEEFLPVRSRINDLEARRQYDAAFVLNHSADNRPRLTTIAENHAWLQDLSRCQPVVAEINRELSRVAESVKEYSGGLQTKANRDLLYNLALKGAYLYGYIVKDQLQAPTNYSAISAKEYIQIVSTRTDAVIPFEFIYDYPAPSEKAALCPKWEDALKRLLESGKSCWEDCPRKSSKKICPLGFWGVRKVIERHILTPEFAQSGKEYFLQSEPATGREVLPLAGTAVVGASRRVAAKALDRVVDTCTKSLGRTARKAADWKAWPKLVKKYSPSVLLALPHTDGSGSTASLEIGGTAKQSIQIEEAYVHGKGADVFPLVALLGCDTAGTAMEYGSHVDVFRWRGAAVVLGTIATVFGGHAAKVAEVLVKGLRRKSKPQDRLGEVIRSIKCRALLDGMVMPLCVVAFGDADWKLDGGEGTDD